MLGFIRALQIPPLSIRQMVKPLGDMAMIKWFRVSQIKRYKIRDWILILVALCEDASSHEVFLLGCAALANITFTDVMACDFLMQHSTPRVLLQACHAHKAHSLFSKDQVWFNYHIIIMTGVLCILDKLEPNSRYLSSIF